MMAKAIGIRVYRISVRLGRSRDTTPFNSSTLSEPVQSFISNYVKSHSAATQNDELERSWYFQQKKQNSLGNCQGYIHYGTFGFESNFVDGKTKKKNYKRKTTDVEEIPLFFEFWCPQGEDFGFVAFQSFQGRSCISLVLGKMKADFEKKNPGYFLVQKKLLPDDAKGSVYGDAQVKRFRLISREVSGDVADAYLGSATPDTIDLEITMSARRRESFGSIKSLYRNIQRRTIQGVLTYEGIQFPEAIAEIRVGNQTRRVGVLGVNGDAGVIDISNDVRIGPDGHPTFASISKETSQILEAFYEIMTGDQS